MLTISAVGLPEADFFFVCGGSADTDWAVTGFRFREALSTVFELTVDLAEDGSTDLRSMVGTAVVFTIARGSLRRVIEGVVRATDQVGYFRSRRHVTVQVVPRLWLLSQRRDHRIFQDVNVLDIVSAVLHDAGLYSGDGELDLKGVDASQHAVREYCTQYGESDLEFVMRLLEDEGVTFFFRSTGTGENLVLVSDGPSDAFPEPIPLLGDLPLRVMGQGGATADAETVRTYGYGYELQPDSVAMRDWDFTRPFHTNDNSPAREVAHTRSSPASVSSRQIYTYPAGAVFTDYSTGSLFYAGDDLQHRVGVRWTEFTGRAQHCTGDSVVTGFAPGRRVHLTDDDGGDLESFSLTSVEHTGRVGESGFDLHPPADTDRYSNRFTGVLVGAIFRPQRVTPRPVMHGPQTAIVMPIVGSKEEVDIDAYGRVLVRFHWERPEMRVDTQRAKNSSCRIRVAQPWAGSGWGVVFNPRVGMEVVVHFLDGDPDRPLITGCVYNLHNQPPPSGEVIQRRTRSTIRTNSSPGSRGYNELYFEDQAGNEEIHIHAQRNFNEFVEFNHNTRVRHNQSVTVTGNQINTVESSQSEIVGGSQSHAVTGSRVSTVGGNESDHVMGLYNLTVDGVVPPPPPPPPKDPGSPPPPPPPPPPPSAAVHVTGDYALESTTKITLTVGGSTVTITPTGVQIVSAGGAGAWFTTEAQSHSSAGSKLTLDDKAILRSSDASQVILDGNARVHANAGADLYLTSAASLHAHRRVNVQNDGGAMLQLQGPLAKLNPGGPNLGPPTTGFGADVDLLAGLSPALRQRISDLQAHGWTIRASRPGDPIGTFADRKSRTIVIDTTGQSAADTVQSLSHEAGHAGYTLPPEIPPSGLTRQQYVDQNTNRNLGDEGAATLFNAQSRQEIINHGGPDVGIAGTHTAQYADIYDQQSAGNITGDQARTQIGQVYGTGESPSTSTGQNYQQYYSNDYSQNWDKNYNSVPPGGRAP